MLQTKSRIQFERERKKANFMNDYERFIDNGLDRKEVFKKLAEIYGYSNPDTARVTYYRWKLELENN